MRIKFWFLTLAACLSMSVMAATTFEFESDALTQTADGFTVTLAKGNGTTSPTHYDNGMRMYAKNTITVSGEGIDSVQIIFSKQGSKAYATLSALDGVLVSGGESTGAADYKIDAWTGTAVSVTFTLGDSGQRLIHKLVINGEATVIEPVDPEKPDTLPSLDPTYTYSEPTEVRVPAMTLQGAEYVFVQNNVEVSCSKGAITENYFSCHAENTVTFRTTKAMKGLTVKGFVKKGFEASADYGNITYMSPTDDDATGDPVLVITDIDTTTVTISCLKQLRCYSVNFYFEANPTDTVEGGESGTGEVFFLDFNSADAVYETEYSVEGNYNYTVYLYNDTADVPYIGLDIYTATLGMLEGTHTVGPDNYSFCQFGEGEDDYTMVTEGAFAITKEGEIYTISGYLTCENNNTYNFTFTGEMPFYTDTEYYDEEQAVDQVPALDNNAVMYDVLGRPVGAGYKGLVIQNGYKYLVR